MLGREVLVRIAKQRLCSGDEFGVRVALPKRGASRGRRHRVDVGIVREPGMRMMVEHRNLFDLRQQPLVDLLNVGSWQWTRLTGRQCGQPAHHKPS